MLVHENLVNAVGEQFFRIFIRSVSADDDAVHFVIDLCRHLSGFADQLVGNRVDVAAFLFDKNQKIAPYILIKRARLLLEADRFFRTSADT